MIEQLGMPGSRAPSGHVVYVCAGRHDRPCMFCDGGLFNCQVCDSFEGATTTHCPGKRMTIHQRDAVYAGGLDYQDGCWILGQASMCAPFGQARREAIRRGREPIPDGYGTRQDWGLE